MTAAGLRRALGAPLLTFYGLGVIIGAGIYVLVGTVVGVAGAGAPWAFLLAGLLAGLTGLSYAELAVRHPESAGAAAYVQEAFGSPGLSRLTGLAVAVVVLFSTASIARGSASYLQVFLPAPDAAIGGAVVLLFTGVACLAVRESVGLAALMTLVEIAGLLLVVAAALPLIDWSAEAVAPLLAPGGLAPLAVGAFLAFFAFIGFENLANMAEEARRPERSLPIAILGSLGSSALLYAVVTAAAILAVPARELAAYPAPLLLVTGKAAWVPPQLFPAIAIVAVANGVLIELVMLARLLYGMARRGWLPDLLAVVAPRQRVPIRATLVGGGACFVLTTALPFVSLVTITSTVTLLVFTLVNLALWRLQRIRPRTGGFRVPPLVPPLAAAANLALIAAQLLG